MWRLLRRGQLGEVRRLATGCRAEVEHCRAIFAWRRGEECDEYLNARVNSEVGESGASSEADELLATQAEKIRALPTIKDILARNHVEQRLADQRLTKETDGSAVRRHDGARAVNREEAVIKHAAKLCQHFRLGYGRKVFRGGHLRLAVVTGDHNSSRSPFKNSSSGGG